MKHPNKPFSLFGVTTVLVFIAYVAGAAILLSPR